MNIKPLRFRLLHRPEEISLHLLLNLCKKLRTVHLRLRLRSPVQIMHTLTPAVEHCIGAVILQIISLNKPSSLLLCQIPLQQSQLITQRFSRRRLFDYQVSVLKIRVDELDMIQFPCLLCRPHCKFVALVQFLNDHLS